MKRRFCHPVKNQEVKSPAKFLLPQLFISPPREMFYDPSYHYKHRTPELGTGFLQRAQSLGDNGDGLYLHSARVFLLMDYGVSPCLNS